MPTAEPTAPPGRLQAALLWVYGEFGGDRRASLPKPLLHASRCSRCPGSLPPQHHHSLRRRMSHHFDYTADEPLDISDAHRFAGAVAGRARDGSGINSSPDAGGLVPPGYDELKFNTNSGLVEDITWCFTFPVDSAGDAARRGGGTPRQGSHDRNAKGRIIMPPTRPSGRSSNWTAASRSSPVNAATRSSTTNTFSPGWGNSRPVGMAPFPTWRRCFPPHDDFLNNSPSGPSWLKHPSRSRVGSRLQLLGNHGGLRSGAQGVASSVQRAGGPNTTTFWGLRQRFGQSQHQRHRPR